MAAGLHAVGSMAHKHGPEEARITCDLPTKKACEDRYTDWQAMQQVLLAYNVVVGGRADRYKKEHSQFAQLVRVIAGKQDAIVNADGNPSEAPWVARLMAAVQRVIAGEVPGYTLYSVGAQPTEQEA